MRVSDRRKQTQKIALVPQQNIGDIWEKYLDPSSYLARDFTEIPIMTRRTQ
jgi:hypothetical protein